MIQRIVKRLFDYKRDYRDNNQTETQGPPGSTGATGPQGPAGSQGIQGIQGPIGPNGTQGSSGITAINASNYYKVAGNTGIINTTTAFVDSIVICLPGDVAISGDYFIFNANPPFPYVHQFRSSPGGGSDLPTGWITTIEGQSPQIVVTVVHCFDNPPLRP